MQLFIAIRMKLEKNFYFSYTVQDDEDAVLALLIIIQD